MPEYAAMDQALLAVPDPMVRLDPEGILVAQNAAADQVFGTWGRGRSYVTLFRQPALVARIEWVLANRAPAEAEFSLTETSGAQTFRVRLAPLGAPLEGMLIHFQDVSHLYEVAEMRRDFVANVSHELRSPLTAILGFIETLQGPAAKDGEAQARFLLIMEQEARRMNRLIGDLLSLSRVESQERQRPDQEIDLTHVIGRVLAALKPMIEDRGSEIVIERDAQFTPMLRGDSDQLTQVFQNLIENALKYGGAGRKVTLRYGVEMAQAKGDFLRIDVIDQGEGIDAVHIPRLTERFYRVDNHRSRAMGGTGLGLAIVKHIVNRHRGRLKITSQQGVGSCFSVFLPRG